MEKKDFLRYFDDAVDWYDENMADGDYSRMILDKLWGYVQSPHLRNRLYKE
jgi:hypothetical protein